MITPGTVAAICLVMMTVPVYVNSLEEITYKECNYLKSTENRENAYVKDGKICCQCSKGTKWEGDCEPSRPNSTVCSACRWDKNNIDDRSFVHYEPHLQKRCFPVRMKNCDPHKKYEEGSATERPRCVCPPGEIKHGKQCKPAPQTASPDHLVQETTSQPKQVDTSPTKGMDIPRRAVAPRSSTPFVPRLITNIASSNKPTTAAKSPGGGERVTQTVTHYDNITTELPETTSNDWKGENQSGSVDHIKIVVPVVFAIVLCAIIVIVIVVLVKKKRSCNPSKDILPGNSCDASHETLTNGNTRGQDVSIEEVRYENPAAENNATPTLARDNRMHEKTDGERRAQKIPLLASMDAETGGKKSLRYEEPPQCARAMNSEQENDFVMDLAKDLAKDMSRVEAKEIFRTFVGSTDYEEDIGHIVRNGERTLDIYIDLMRWLRRILGNNLTLKYLLEKAKLLPYKLIVDIIEDKMRNLGMEVPQSSTACPS